MERKLRKVLLSLACSLICTSVIGLSAVNMSLELTITTDRDEYSSGEEILVDISLKNGTDSDIKDISLNSEIPEGLNLKEGSDDYSTDLLSKGESLLYSYTLVDSGYTEVVNPGEGQEDQTDEENPINGEDVSNQENIEDQNRNINNSAEKVTNVNSTGKTKSINTSDKDSSYLILIFVLSFIIIIGLTNKKVRKRFFIVIFIGGLVSSSFVNVSAIDENTNTKELSSFAVIIVNNTEYVIDVTCTYFVKESNDFIPSEDAEYYYDDNMYGDSGNSENISYNNDTVELYYNNEIIVSLKDELSSEQESKLLSYLEDAIIVGKNAYTKTYQIRFKEEKTFEELNQIKDTLISRGYENVHLNHVVNYENNTYYPNDELWKDNWSDIPEGTNWNMEAINAPCIWDYKDNMADVEIGILDQGFTENHDDLNKVFTLISPNADPKSRNHGTHVSGIIGAQFDNEEGICGVCPTAKMIGTTTAYNRTEFVYTLNLTRLITEGCEVINMSMAESADYIFVASQSTDTDARKKMQQYLTNQADTLTYYLKALLNDNFDFVIATCAGNQQYIEIIKTDDSISGYGTIDNKGYLNYIDLSGNRVQREPTITESDNSFINEGVDSFWTNALTTITDERLKSRIIVVGAVQLNEDGTYKRAYFSSKGSRVDVMAPGFNIYSTVDNVDNNKYYIDHGTSMASPHVAGLAGTLLALDSKLNGQQIKEIIINSANIVVDDSDGRNMINAEKAYENLNTGSVSGRVVDIEGLELNDVMIEITSTSGKLKSVNTDQNGDFSTILPIGTYDLTFIKDGYNKQTININLEGYTTPISLDNIILQKGSSIKISINGKVIDEENKPLSDVIVEIKNQSNKLLQTLKTNETGEFAAMLENGTYNLVFSKDGYETVTKENFIVYGSISKLDDIVLKESDDHEKFVGGDGSEENPYQVSTPEQLNAVRNDLDAHYVQINDIDLSVYDNWEPIGSYKVWYNEEANRKTFAGTYDGNNYKIKNLTINDRSDLATLGLFGNVNGTLKNISLDNMYISVDKSNIDYKTAFGSTNAHNVVIIGGIAGITSGIIENCIVSGEINGINLSSTYVGGITGSSGIIVNCKNFADLSVICNQCSDNRYENDNSLYIGGISGAGANISNSLNYGSINATSGCFMYCGGISGYDGHINTCINKGTVIGKTTDHELNSSFAGNCNVGGIVGASSWNARNSINYGDVYGKAFDAGNCFAGGIVGYCGYYGGGELDNCYNLCNIIEGYEYQKKDGILTKQAGSVGRIFAASWTTRLTNLYSKNTTLVNDSIATEFIDETESNGKSLTESEINEKIQYILDELGI